MAITEKLRRLFPHASKSFMEANPNPGLPDSEQQPVRGSALDETVQRKPESYERAHVRFTAFTTRPADPDNIAGGSKFLLDSIKKLGLIPDDNAYCIELEVRQRKVDHQTEEKTLVEIEYK